MKSPRDITRKSGSNLAIALSTLPGRRRDDMVDFYAFCRIVDDIADDPERPARQKREKLGLWRMAAESGFTGDGWLHPELSSIIDRHQIPINLFIEIIDGVSQDIEPVRYQTLDDLLAYCYQVASAVGLVSVRIFGCGEDEDALNYGINLGYCLQLTNIMRDVAEDFQNDGRIYLPIGIMDKFGYSEEELRAGKYTPNFVALMDFLYHEASHFYQLTASYIQPTFRPRLVATEMMVTVYRRILEKMHKDRYQVFSHRYGLSKPEKAIIFASSWMQSKWTAPFPKDSEDSKIS